MFCTNFGLRRSWHLLPETTPLCLDQILNFLLLVGPAFGRTWCQGDGSSSKYSKYLPSTELKTLPGASFQELPLPPWSRDLDVWPVSEPVDNFTATANRFTSVLSGQTSLAMSANYCQEYGGLDQIHIFSMELLDCFILQLGPRSKQKS